MLESQSLMQSVTLEQKHFKSEFIYKLVDIMKKYPRYITWTENKKSIQINNKQQFQKEVLPQYFRHSNFQSFLRQLHLYNFKQHKQIKDGSVFTNSEFYLENEKNFCLIQRDKKKKQKKQLIKQLQKDQTLKNIIENKRLKICDKNILYYFLQYKFVIIQKQKKLKEKLKQLIQKLKTSKSNVIKEHLEIIDQQIKDQLNRLKSYSTNIDMNLNSHLQDFIPEVICEVQNQDQVQMPDQNQNNQKVNQKQIPTSPSNLQADLNSKQQNTFNKQKIQQTKDRLEAQNNQRMFLVSNSQNPKNYQIDKKINVHFQGYTKDKNQQKLINIQKPMIQNILQKKQSSTFKDYRGYNYFFIPKDPSQIFPLPIEIRSQDSIYPDSFTKKSLILQNQKAKKQVFDNTNEKQAPPRKQSYSEYQIQLRSNMAVIYEQKEPKTRSQVRKYKKIQKQQKKTAATDKKSKNIILKSEQLDNKNNKIKQNETSIKGQQKFVSPFSIQVQKENSQNEAQSQISFMNDDMR